MTENSCDRYTVAVKRSGVVIGHLLQKLSRVCSLFLRCGGVIVYGNWRLQTLRRYTPRWSRNSVSCCSRTSQSNYKS